MSLILEKLGECWLPEQIEPISSIVELACKYSDNSLAFAVFKTGTVVFSDQAKYEGDGPFLATLSDFIKHPPDSEIWIMNDGNYLIKFMHSIRGIVLNDFYKSHRKRIEENIEEKGLMSGEHLFQDERKAMRGDRFYISLYARAKLFKDIFNPEIVERYEPVIVQ